MKVKAPRGYHFMKKKGKYKLMKNPKGGYKKHKGSSLTMSVPVVKRHRWAMSLQARQEILYLSVCMVCEKKASNKS